MRITKNSIDKVFKAKQESVENMTLKGYELLGEYMVDNSGFGQEGELAHTKDQFLTKVGEWLDIHQKLTAKITSVGQFQVYVGLFIKKNKPQMRKIGNNTYKIETADGYKIRLHDTDIIEVVGDKMILNSGGWQTHTTKERINKYIKSGYRITQKQFNWFLNNTIDNTITPFADGIEI